MGLIEDIQAQIDSVKSQIAQVIPQTRTLRIERTNCINLGSPFAAKSAGFGQTCREIPITESFFDSNQQATLRPLNETLAQLEEQLSIASAPKITTPKPITEMPKLNDTAASPNAITLGIPGLVVIGGIIALFILGRKN